MNSTMDKVTETTYDENGETISTREVSLWAIRKHPEFGGEDGIYIETGSGDDTDDGVGITITEDVLLKLGYVRENIVAPFD